MLVFFVFVFFFFQAEDGIRDLVRSRGLGDVYKRQGLHRLGLPQAKAGADYGPFAGVQLAEQFGHRPAQLSLIHI